MHMKICANDIANAIAAWIDDSLLPRSSLLQQGIITFCLLQGRQRLLSVIDSMMFLSEDGEFDYDEFRKNTLSALDKAGGTILLPIINYKFDKDDMEQVLEYLKDERIK